MKSRLDKIKQANDVLNSNNPAWKEEIDWLIKQAGKTERYEKTLHEIYSRKREIYRSIGVLISKTLEE